MAKRKIASNSDKTPTKKLKTLKGDANAAKVSVSKLSFDSSEQCLRSLVYPTSFEDFFAKYWEKEPLFIARKDQNYYKDFPSKAKLEEIIKKEQLEYDKDIFLSQDEDGTETLEAEGRATVKSIQKYFKEKFTILFNKPHRFHTELYRLLELLEGHFGCCVDCYLETHTKKAHSREPGFTGKESIILQTEGKKKWCLFEPVQKLSYVESESLMKDQVGEMTHEFILEQGDLLYFPRGTVYQTHSIPGEVSSHIMMELYEEYSWGRFLSSIVSKAVIAAQENDVTFREGLPINFLSYMGYGKKEFSDDAISGKQSEGNIDKAKITKTNVPSLSEVDVNNQKSFKEKMEKMFSSLAQYLDPHWAADTTFGETYMTKRLAPSEVEEKPSDKDEPPNDKSLIQLKHPGHIRITLYEPEDEELDEDDDGSNESDESTEDEADEEEEKKDSKKKSKKSEQDDTKGEGSNVKDEKKSQKAKVKSSAKEQDKKEGEDGEMAEDDEEEKKKDSKKKSKKSEQDDRKGEGSNVKNEKKSQRAKVKSSAKEQDKKEEEDGEMAEDDEEDFDESFEDGTKPCIIVCHCLYNKVVSDEGQDDEYKELDSEDEGYDKKENNKLKFPVHYCDALLILHRTPIPVVVKDLPLTSGERMALATTLWREGLLTVTV